MSATMDIEEQLEQQPPVKKSRMDGPSTKEESAEIAIQNDGVQEDNADNYVNNINAPTEELDKMKKENEALREKLKKAEQKAQMVKNELEKIIQQQKNPENLEALLANVIAILKEQQQKDETSSSSNHGLEWNPEENGWEVSNTGAIISSNGLLVSDNTQTWQNVFAKEGFPISGELSCTDKFPGTILYYFEVTLMADSTQMFTGEFNVGFSDGHKSYGFSLGSTPNSYCFDSNYYQLSGDVYAFELPNEPELKDSENVYGCGIMLDPENKLSIFFTLNGTLLGKQIPISPSVDYLYPTVSMCNVLLEANFGTDSAKPFEYSIEKCPGMGYDD